MNGWRLSPSYQISLSKLVSSRLSYWSESALGTLRQFAGSRVLISTSRSNGCLSPRRDVFRRWQNPTWRPHTEDWDHRRLRGISPKRILAEVRHDQFDIYENRVTARLLDNLAAYLNRRISKLNSLIRMFQEKEDFSSEMSGTYQRHRRISKLWGESIDANEGRRKAEATLKELERLKYKLMSLHGSTLYEEVPTTRLRADHLEEH